MSDRGASTVRAALGEARALGVAALDAQRMLAHLLQSSRTAVIAHDERALDSATATRWQDWLGRRAAGEPLAYLLGEKEFHGLRFEVTADVLVPRPETELLVEWALEVLSVPWSGDERRRAMVDLGTGSGAIAVAVAAACRGCGLEVAFTAVDRSSAALAVTRRNAASHGVALRTVEASWWDALADARFDVVVANPPYVAAGDPALDALHHEPRGALVSGADGLDAIREIVAGAPAHLSPSGWLLVEHGADQGASVRERFEASGLRRVATRRDLAGLERATGGQAPPSS